MKNLHNMQEFSININQINEPKNSYGLTPKEKSFLPTFLSMKVKLSFKKFCYKLDYKNGILGFSDMIDRNYIPNNKHGFYPEETHIYKYNTLKDNIFMNNKKRKVSIPLTKDELYSNIKNAVKRTKDFIVEPFYLPALSLDLFETVLINRIKNQLESKVFSIESLNHRLELIREVHNNPKYAFNKKETLDEIVHLYIDAIERAELNEKDTNTKETKSNSLEDLQKTSIDRTEKKRSPIEIKAKGMKLTIFYDGKVEIVKDGIKTLENSLIDEKFSDKIYEDFKDEECFDCTKSEFIDALGLIGNPKKVKIIKKQNFYFLMHQIFDSFELNYNSNIMREYRKVFFRRILECDDNKKNNSQYRANHNRSNVTYSDNFTIKINRHFKTSLQELTLKKV